MRTTAVAVVAVAVAVLAVGLAAHADEPAHGSPAARPAKPAEGSVRPEPLGSAASGRYARDRLRPAEPAVVEGRASSPGKPRAPVRIDSRLDAAGAHLTIRFDSAGEEVAVRVYGVGGLRVTSPERPIAGAAVAAGEVRELDVRFTAPAGRSHLAVSVAGRFAGGRRATVQSFAVGHRSEAQRREAASGVRQTPSGERLKPLPAKEPR